MASSVNQFPVRIFAVIVLYKMRPSESAAYRTLRAAISGLQDGQADIKILLYDNTPGGQDAGVLPAGVQYKADIENSGLATAYNYALEIAKEEGFDWLLTLDQDTGLPVDFIYKLRNTAMFVAQMPNVAAIVPCLSGNGRPISPSIPIWHWALTKFIPDGFIGIPQRKYVFAVNSASTFKVSALRSVGGYDEHFWLDFSDVVLYYRLHARCLEIFVAGNIYVEHELSPFDLANRTTPGRYENIRFAEEAFYDEYLGKAEGLVLLLRLLYRLTFSLWRAGASVSYFRIGLKFVCRRLFWSRQRRLENWRQTASQHLN